MVGTGAVNALHPQSGGIRTAVDPVGDDEVEVIDTGSKAGAERERDQRVVGGDSRTDLRSVELDDRGIVRAI